jgi:murein DD-endopeptidase MepM/ murein hydrolase activator NlpD
MVMMQRRILGLLVFFLIVTKCEGQDYPQNYFRNPLNIPMELVANFGELRANHWHMGLDIRTQQKQNLPVHAAAEGYITRVKIEPGGFGRAIYINHPNGYTTLYAHLNNFFPALEQYVKAEQYKLESWQVELEIAPNLFPINKGSFIAYSGNTGGSQGPHVHFEIRETKTDR